MSKIISILMVVFLCTTCFIFGQEETEANNIEKNIVTLQNAIDMIWLIVCASLVFLMQAGFAMLTAGLTRAKNAGNVLMKNLMDFSVGALVFWIVGWGIMYGKDMFGIFGGNGFFLQYSTSEIADYGASSMNSIYRDWMFQVVFAGTAATIISGAIAERLKFYGYLIYSAVITALIYPISGHWVWGGGWLSQLGFYDFAGSTVVHAVGGLASLAGAFLIGPRIGKYFKHGNKITTKAILGHNIPLAALGTFILWFGWYGFNAGSTLSGTDSTIAAVAVTTTLAAGAGAIGALITSWLLFKKPEPTMSLNGALAGLVGITAGCAVVGTASAVLIGFLAGILVVLSVEFFDKILHIDDPVGAISVHGTCGIWGTLAVGLFANTESMRGLFFGGGADQLVKQLIGVGAVGAWVLVSAFTLFGILKACKALRVSPAEERKGLDISEHGSESYSGFQIFSEQ